MNSYGRQPITVDTWPGPMKPSSRRSGESRMALMAGMIVTWLQNTEKFVSPSRGGAQHGHRGGRRRGLEPDGHEHDLPVRVLPGDLQRVQRRVHHPDVGAPAALASKNDPPLPGTRIMSPNEVMITSGCEARCDGVVHAAHRDHAHRAAGAVHQRDRLGQVVLEAVLVDGVGVPAAHLHELVLAARLAQRRDLRGERVGLVRITEFVDEPHRPHAPPDRLFDQ